MDQLSQLDELVESDILDALGQETKETTSEKDNTQRTEDESIIIEDVEKIEDTSVEAKEVNTNEISMSELKVDDLASLLSQLLNNKTIEITIKIKD